MESYGRNYIEVRTCKKAQKEINKHVEYIRKRTLSKFPVYKEGKLKKIMMKTHFINKNGQYETKNWFTIVLIFIGAAMFFYLWFISLNYYGYPDREGSWFQEVLEFLSIYLYIIPSMFISLCFTIGLNRLIIHSLKK